MFDSKCVLLNVHFIFLQKIRCNDKATKLLKVALNPNKTISVNNLNFHNLNYEQVQPILSNICEG